jgi:hypothetical protein
MSRKNLQNGKYFSQVVRTFMWCVTLTVVAVMMFKYGVDRQFEMSQICVERDIMLDTAILEHNAAEFKAERLHELQLTDARTSLWHEYNRSLGLIDDDYDTSPVSSGSPKPSSI